METVVYSFVRHLVYIARTAHWYSDKGGSIALTRKSIPVYNTGISAGSAPERNWRAEHGDIRLGLRPDLMPYSRKRAYSSGNAPMTSRVRRTLAHPTYSYVRGSRGYTRTSGNYGRYSRAVTSHPEKKFFDTVISSTPVTTGGLVGSLSLVPQGDLAQNHVGNRLFVTKLNMRAHFFMPSTTDVAETSDTVRIIILQDTQTNGALATVANVLASADMLSFNNLTQGRRFNTLADKFVTLNTGGLAGTTAPAVASTEVHRFLHLKHTFKTPMEMNFSGATGAITEIRSNGLLVLLISFTGIIQSVTETRIRFTD